MLSFTEAFVLRSQRSRQTTDTSNVINSAIGTAIQTPLSFHRAGKSRTPGRIQPNVLKKEISAERFPSDKEVNSAEAKIFTPANR